MGDQPKRTISTRLPMIEQNVAPVREETFASPPASRLPISESRDDLEHVMQLDKLERERAALLVQLQDAEEARLESEREREAVTRERDRLREQAPVAIFPPESIRPPAPTPPELQQAVIESDIDAIRKAVVKSKLGRGAITVGVLLALGWNAFNTARLTVPTQKAEAIQARQAQVEQLSADEFKQRVLESERNYQRWRAVYCYMKQLRGASARQGLDLPSLPPGGVKALRLGDEDPNRPGPPRFVAEEVCPEFPALPPEPHVP